MEFIFLPIKGDFGKLLESMIMTKCSCFFLRKHLWNMPAIHPCIDSTPHLSIHLPSIYPSTFCHESRSTQVSAGTANYKCLWAKTMLHHGKVNDIQQFTPTHMESGLIATLLDCGRKMAAQVRTTSPRKLGLK